jgi:nitrile hydratase
VNGVHDLGGMHNFGPVVIERGEPVFHHPWERRAFALTLAAGFLGRWNLDETRYARELMPPAEYLAASYYERWLWALERQLVAAGLVDPQELEVRLRGGEARAPDPPASSRPAGVRVLEAAQVDRVLRTSRSHRLEVDLPARFRPGQAVVTKNLHPAGHTRLPRYARGKRGVVERDHGVWVFPDAHAAGLGKQPARCYGVRFTARELWGPDGDPRASVALDLFEPYLDPA